MFLKPENPEAIPVSPLPHPIIIWSLGQGCAGPTVELLFLVNSFVCSASSWRVIVMPAEVVMGGLPADKTTLQTNQEGRGIV